MFNKIKEVFAYYGYTVICALVIFGIFELVKRLMGRKTR